MRDPVSHPLSYFLKHETFKSLNPSNSLQGGGLYVPKYHHLAPSKVPRSPTCTVLYTVIFIKYILFLISQLKQLVAWYSTHINSKCTCTLKVLRITLFAFFLYTVRPSVCFIQITAYCLLVHLVDHIQED